MVENIFYFSDYNGVIFLRANPGHAVFSAIWGAAYGSWVAKEISLLQMLKYMLYGIGLHALWNFCADFHGILFSLVFIGVAWLWFVFVRRELKTAPVLVAQAE